MGLQNVLGFVVALICVPIFAVLLLNAPFIRPSRENGHFGNIVFQLTLFILVAIFAFVTLNAIPIAESLMGTIFCVVVSLFVAFLFTTLYRRESFFRKMMAFTSTFILVVPIYFLIFTPVKSLFRTGKVTPYSTLIESDIPIILVMFDEFSPLPLFNVDGSINEIRFPNFSALSQDSLVFNNAASSHVRSFKAVPAALSAKIPPEEALLPVHSNYPDNVFTFLGGSYNLKVLDNFTALCPRNFCEDDEAQSFNVSDLWSDIKVILRHIYTPKAFSHHLPPLDVGWRDFDSQQREHSNEEYSVSSFKVNHANANKVKHSRVNSIDDVKVMDEFINLIDGEYRTFYYLHTIFPHRPYQLLPNLDYYEANKTPNPLVSEIDRMVAYHRYLWQLGAADKMVGNLIERLKSVGLYEDSLIIITADHGLTFIPGLKSRTNIPENPSALHIPMIVKLPNSNEVGVRSKPVSNIDLLPTIADVLGVNIPWRVDGISMLKPRNDPMPDISIREGRHPTSIIKHSTIANREYFKERHTIFSIDNPISEIRAAIAYPSLLGTEPISNGVLEDKGTMKVSTLRYENIDKSRDSLPVFLDAELPEEFLSSEFNHIAVALNNRISTITAPILAGSNKLNITFAPADLKDGKNTISFFGIKRNFDGSPSLWEIPSETDDLVPLVRPENVLMPKKGGLRGSFRMRDKSRDGSLVIGWAIDESDNPSVPISIGVYKNGVLVTARKLDSSSARKTFKLILPTHNRNSGIEIIAFTDDNKALLLNARYIAK